MHSHTKPLILSFGIAVAGLSTAFAGTWQNPVIVSPTLTTTTTGGVYTSSSTLAVGDAVMATATAGGLTKNDVYYVVAANAGNYTLSATPGGAAITGTTTTGQTITSNGIVTWDAAGATDTQSAASWDTTPNATDAVATVSNNSNLSNNAVAIQNAMTIGTLNDSATNNDLNLISSNNGTTTTLSALTFATSTGTPTITNTGNHVIRLGLSDASYNQGTLAIAGTQGLILNAVGNGTTAGLLRIENVNWSGFTNGSGGVGTLTLQAGQISTQVTNALGSGTGALNVVIGNASSVSGATAPELVLSNGKSISVNNLDGTSNGYISGAGLTLTIGAGNGTNVGFAGTIGQTAAGVNSALNLTKAGTGTQTISGNIVGTTANVTVSAGTLVLNGTNTYTGNTTVASGATLSVGGNLGATFITVNGTLQVGSATALGSSTISAMNGTFDLNGQTLTSGTVADKALGNGSIITNTSSTAADMTGLGTLGATATRSITVTGIGNITFGQQFTGSYNITKTGSNTLTLSGSSANNLTITNVSGGVLVLAKTGGVNAVNGANLTISTGGTVQLNGSNQINTGTGIVLSGGTFQPNSYSASVGVLTLSANSTIDLTNGGSMAFANSNAATWSGNLSIIGTFISGSSLQFGSNATGLTTTQLADISIAGFSNLGLNSSGFLTATAIPEPRTFGVLAGLCILGFVACRRRTRR